MPSLTGAYTRLVRAFEQIASLTEDIYRSGSTLTAGTDEAGNFADLDSVAPMLTVLVAETVHSLRGALDHLVYQLAVFDSGQPQQGTRFPLCPAAADFYSGDGLFALTGLDEPHTERIEALQPYNRVAWSRRLLELSDPYLQRHLVLIAPLPDPNATVASAESTRILAFEDGAPVVTTLGELAQEVSKVLDSFNGEFVQG